MTYYDRNALIDIAASVFAGLALAVAIVFIFWQPIMDLLR